MATLKELIGQIFRFRLQAILLITALLIDVGYDTLLPLSLKFLVDRAIVPQDFKAFIFILSTLGIAFLLSVISAVGRDYLYAWLGAHVLHDFRIKLFRHLQRLPMDFFSRVRTGDLVTRFSTDLAAVENVLVIGLPGAFLSVFNILASTTVLFMLEWKLAFFLFISLPFCILGPRLLGPRALRAGYKLRQEQGVLASMVQENLQAQQVIKAFSLQGSALEKFQAQSSKILHSGFSFGFYCYSTERTPNIGMGLFNVLVLCVGGYLAFRGDLSIGSLVSFKALFFNVSSSVLTLSSFAPTLLQATGGLQRIHELLDEPSLVEDRADAITLPPLSHAIRLENISFRYFGSQRQALQDVTLEIPRGARVAFVGPSGCGKSTSLGLILRFFDPEQGVVSYDGLDLRQASLASISAQLGVVFQENFLFDTTIRENVRMGRPDATEAEIEEACRQAELHDLVVTMPDGYDTVVGEGGNRLSGGQRQRVAIARALIRKPSILVLDEATSALDPATEAAVNATLEQLARRQTTIAVTHRLDPLVGFDCIFVFEDGRLVESGAHAELLSRGGLYADLWSKQHGVIFSDDGAQPVLDPDGLSRITIFRDLDDASRPLVSSLFFVEEAAPGSVIFRQGEIGDKFYILARGRVRVTACGEDGIDRELAVLQDGDNFGEVALLEDSPRNATVTTETPTVLLSLRRTAFQRLLDRNPTIRAAIREQTERRRGADAVKLS